VKVDAGPSGAEYFDGSIPIGLSEALENDTLCGAAIDTCGSWLRPAVMVSRMFDIGVAVDGVTVLESLPVFSVLVISAGPKRAGSGAAFAAIPPRPPKPPAFAGEAAAGA
jgi:hypothetical protein